ncbi:cation/H(+) antiporter 15-like isoform X2 [Magnolia sinica]|nr:cation/H(+) antiporter 15-like isoform X2 [Magnolia sinica]
MVGPTFLGRSDKFSNLFFPRQSFYTTATLAKLGTMFYFLFEGLKMEPMLIRKSGKREVVIAVWGICIPLVLFTCIYYILVKFHGSIFSKGMLMPLLNVSLSITAFPVIQPILTELNLLNTELGRITLSITLINFATSWAFTLIHDSVINGSIFPVMSLMYLICIFSLALFVVFVIRPVALWIIRRTHVKRVVDKSYIIAFQFMTLVIGFTGNMLGTTVNTGPLMMGLAMPDGPPLAAAIVEKTESIVNVIFLPLFYATVGLRTNMLTITDWRAFTSMEVLFITAFMGKLVGTILPALHYQIPLSDALALGLIMNFRGIVEMILFVHWHDDNMLRHQDYGILVLTMVLFTAISTPLVHILTRNSRPYTPYNRRTMEHCKPRTELCILTCINSQDNVPTIINLLEATHSTLENPICVYILNLVELVGCAIPILIEHDKIKRSSSVNQSSHIVGAFRNYEQRNNGCVAIRPFTTMAPYSTMHHDVCKLALDKKVSLVIVPYHKQQAIDGMDIVDRGFRTINPQILAHAPCSVGILVDHAKQSCNVTSYMGNNAYRVGVIFMGSCDCREVLSHALRMSGNPLVTITVMRLMMAEGMRDCMVEKQLDDQLVAHFRIECMGNDRVVYREEVVSNGEETVTAIRSMGSDYDLMMVGRRVGMGTVLVEGLIDWNHCPELGVIGDILAAPDFFNHPVSVLVVQQGRRGSSAIQIPGRSIRDAFIS